MLDTLIKNGTVVDGSGGPRIRADIGVRGGRIVAIGEISEAATERLPGRPVLVELCPSYPEYVI